jgi:Mechanosensitive ion channel, conserved TM helix
MAGTATGEAVFGPFRDMWTRVLNYLPNLAAGILLALLGIVVCWLVKKALVRLLLLMRLDRPLKEFGWARPLAQADVRHSLANLLGNIAAGLVFPIFLENALVVWDLDVLARLIGSMVFYIPRFIVGTLVFLIGSGIAVAVASRVRLGLAAEGFARAGLVGRLCHWALMIVVTAFTLEELGIAPHTVQAAFKIGLGSLGLLVALALGLGSRDAVARIWQSFLEKPPTEP